MTNICDLFGINLPLIQAPMAGVQKHELAAAVSNAGGLGSLPCAMLSSTAIKEETYAFREKSKGPLNLNFFSHKNPVLKAGELEKWNEALSDYYSEFDLKLTDPDPTPARQPFNNELVQLVEELKPEVISFHFGLPDEDLLNRARGTGAKIISSATTVEEAIWLESKGVDAIIAQGLEAGGHRGIFLSDDINTQVGTMSLLPQILANVRTPVIASGGIADAKSVKAAMDLGAAGVQLGTVFLLCPESQTSDIHREALKNTDSRVTALTNVFTGRPARGIVNRIIREQGPISPNAPQFPMATAAMAPLRSKAESMGSGDFSPLWSGQNTSGCKEISAAELASELMSLLR
ncbi:DUF561 domain-containing protein [Sneathiella sp. P13V-1]|uniref:NAD(P)H-dependent flavin oxidoreductase n=1 Tax=Sneathiella sp. P13V-1 TaxID=2697366 RepID=UPI00187B3E9C|nr:nitronate monooxygenase [Sneathiella sp. P13V-1]MBE7635318.1 DUF561 domain-containing protein [Sneathiella sp. P13V-1]